MEYFILVTFVIALLTYTLTVEPTMSFGIVVNTLLLLQTAGRASTRAFISNDWRVLDVCHRQSTYCSNGKYDFCLFKRIYNLIFLFLVFIDNLKKLVNKTNEAYQ
jgi:hypothetical protein